MNSDESVRSASNAIAGTILAVVVVCLGIHASPLCAATFTWDGGGANDYLSTAANWNPDGAPPFNGTADLIFAGTTRLNPFVLGTNWSIDGLTFDSTAGAFSIFGNPWHVGAGGFANNSSGVQTLNNIYVDSAQTWNASAGDLSFTSLYASGSTRVLTIDGAHVTVISGSIDDGSGQFAALGIIKTGAGALALNGGVKKQLAGDLETDDGATFIAGDPVSGGAALVGLFGNILIGTQENNKNAVMDVITPGLAITQIPTGFLSIDGGPPVSPTGGIVVGADQGSTGTLNIANGAIVQTAAGGLVIHKTGRVTIGTTDTTGRLETYGNVAVDGGVFEQNSGSLFAPYPQTTLTVQNGGRFTLANAYTLSSSRSATVTGEGSLLETAAGFTVDTAALHVQAGGAVSAASYLDIAKNAGGELLVDGAGSTVTVSGQTASQWGANGYEADAFFDNGATAEFDGGITATNTGIVYIGVDHGARLSAGPMLSLNAGDSGSLSLLQIGAPADDAGGATVTINPNGQLVVGTSFTHYTNVAAPISIYPGGSLIVGPGGTTHLNKTGGITIAGGTADLQNLPVYDGQLTFESGSLSYLGYLDVGADTVADIRALGPGSQTISSNRSLTVSQGTYIHSGYTLTLDGGELNTSYVYTSNYSSLYGTLDFQSGTLGITGPDGVVIGYHGSTGLEQFGEYLNVSTNMTLNVTHTLTISDGNLVIDGGTVTAGALVNNFGLGSLGGTLSTGGLINHYTLAFAQGHTDVYGSVTNDTTSPDGLNFSGFDVSPSATFWGDVINTKGSIFNVAPSASVTFNASYSGDGISGGGQIHFAGGINPGFSPAAVSFVGNVTLESTASLNIELGGTAVGSQFDHVTVADHLALDGVLAVTLIDGFLPGAGDTFDILDWGTLSGQFASLDLPALGSGLTWNTSQLYAEGILSVAAALAGDYNNNGVVDAADYVVWRAGLGTIYTQADYDVWRAHFGETAGSGSASAVGSQVPEPSSLVLFVIMLTGTFFCRRAFRNCSGAT